MKIKLSFILAGLICAASILTGCNTVTTTNANGTRSFDAQKTAKVIKTVIPPAVVYADQNAVQYRKFIVDAQVVACSLVGSTNVSPDEIKIAFASTGINEIQSPEIEGVTATVYGLYSSFYDDLISAHLPQDQIVTNATIVIQAICDGLSQGLAESPASAAVQIGSP